MPLYIIFGKYTQEGITKIKEAPQRVDAAKRLAASVGGEIKEFFFTMGQYDFVVLIEAPNNETMMKTLFMVGRGGAARTETLVALPLEKAAKIIKELP